MRFTPARVATAAAGTAVCLGLGMGAYAFFTAPGDGEGSATVGTATAVDLRATTDGALFPGGPARDVTITVTNPGDGNQHVDTVSLARVESDQAACDTGDFAMADVVVDANLAAGSSTTRTGQLSMLEDGDQDACQGATLTLHLTSN
jgi:hypothetical protein